MSAPQYSLILRQCQLIQPGNHAVSSQPLADLAIQGNIIVAIAPQLEATAIQEIQVQGKLVSPPFIESHIHLDTTLTAGDPRWNQSGTLFEGIDIWAERKQKLTTADVQARALKALKLQASQGILWARTHVDTSEPTLTAMRAMLELRDRVKDWITVQVVAFPQDGIYGQLQNEALVEEALKLGADVVGGIPHYELTREDGVRSIHRIFDLAEQYDRLIDVHCDEIDDDQSRFLEVMAACAYRRNLGARVTASHTTAFGSYNNAYAFKLMGLLQRSQINFVANPLVNITLQGRMDTYPKRRGLTRIKELWQSGLNVSLGHDDLQDPWYSLGTGNMLDVAHMAVHAAQLTGLAEIDACYDMVTTHAARTLGIESQYGIAVGQPANLIVLDAENRYEAIRKRATVETVISRGNVIATTTPPQVHCRI
ncbi:MAG: cytosine deaminase [Cyanobacteria bacterium P01_H01_bin.121]